MGVDLNNPAARLESALMTLSGQSRDHSPLTTFCRLWDLDESHPRERLLALKRMTELVPLVIEVRQRAEAVPRFGPMVLRNFEKVEETVFNLVGMARSHHLQHAMQSMDPTAWTSLQQLHDLLDDEHARWDLADDKKDDLLSQIVDLMDQVRRVEDLDDVQRSTMLNHLLLVQAALLNVDIGGPRLVEEAVDGLMGGMIRLSIRTRTFAQHPVAAAALKLVGLIATALGIAADWNALTAGGITTLMIERGGHEGDIMGGGTGGGGSD